MQKKEKTSRVKILLICLICLAAAVYLVHRLTYLSDEECLAVVSEATGITIPADYQDLGVYWYEDFVGSGTLVYVELPSDMDVKAYALREGFEEWPLSPATRFPPLECHIPWLSELPKAAQRTCPEEGPFFTIQGENSECLSYNGVISGQARALWLYVAWH